MGMNLNNIKIKNCGTGIKAEGKADISLTGGEFENNGKDIDLYVDETSKIDITDFVSTGNGDTQSISYVTYSSGISEAKNFVESKTDHFTQEEIQQIKELLDKAEKEPSKLKQITSQILSIGTGVGSALLVEYLKMKFKLG